MAWTHEGGKHDEGQQEDHVHGQHQGGGSLGGQGICLDGEGALGKTEGGNRPAQHVLQGGGRPDRDHAT
eukprot:14726320-Heterocapsa_arctica.AAC.1